MKKLGLIVNPIAGMGGSVGLKGTDGEIIKEAMKLRALPVAAQRVEVFLSCLKSKRDFFLLVAPDKMGEELVKGKGFNYEVIGQVPKETTATDTERIAKLMLDKGIDLLIFCGGDGTARDIADVVKLKIPVVAIPSGVKMFSSVFALNPKAAAQLVDKFIEGTTETQEKEILVTTPTTCEPTESIVRYQNKNN